MTTTTTDERPLIPPPAHLDAPPEIIDIGEDGNYLVGYGHIDPRVFVCLGWTHIATLIGVQHVVGQLDVESDRALEEWAESVEHRWAVEEEAHGEPLLRWGGVHPTTIGAFPITILDQEV